MPAEKECQLCHDGTMKQAPDVVKLTDPYPRGHYRETTHTALATKMDEPVSAAVGGTASATCGDCHSRDLRKAHTEVPAVEGSEYGESVGCGECHNDVRSGGLAQVLTDWKGRACKDCHKTGSSSPQHRSNRSAVVEAKSPLGCGSTGAGCHDVNDLHAIHKDKPKNCAGSCRGRRGELPRDRRRGRHAQRHHLRRQPRRRLPPVLRERHVQPQARRRRPLADELEPRERRSFYDTPCGDCHRMNPDGTSLNDEHALPTSAKTEDPANVCINCHNNAASVDVVEPEVARSQHRRVRARSATAIKGLPAAHEGDLTVQARGRRAPAARTRAPAVTRPTTTCRWARRPPRRTSTATACAATTGPSPTATSPTTRPRRPAAKAATATHRVGAYNPTTDVHDGAAGLTNGSDSAHHAAGAAQANAGWDDSSNGAAASPAIVSDAASGLKTACSACHSMTLGAEHCASELRARQRRRHRVHAVPQRRRDRLVAREVELVRRRSGAQACAACHVAAGSRAIHALDRHGARRRRARRRTARPQPGSCVRSGCHATLDLRVLHAQVGLHGSRAATPVPATSSAAISRAAAGPTRTPRATRATRPPALRVARGGRVAASSTASPTASARTWAASAATSPTCASSTRTRCAPASSTAAAPAAAPSATPT